MSDKPISQYVEDMFPSFYKEEGPLFIQFVKAYYEWLEQEGNVQYHVQNLPNYFDIDKTIDDFITHFRQQYLPSLEFSAETDKRTILKHAREFLATKGTEENIQLLLRLVYNQDSTIFRPNEKVLRPSDGVWFEPKYLELTPSNKTLQFIGRNIVGSQSGAQALAERVVRKTVGGVTFDVLYISQVKGNFLYKEIITSDGLLDDCPKVIGSLTSIDLVSGGKDFSVGDVVTIESTLTGKSGLGRVSSVGTATGRVTFNLLDGGYGFTSNAIVYVSDRVLNLSNKTINPSANSTNGGYFDFALLEEVVQPLQTTRLLNLSQSLTVNTFVRGHAANGTIVANGYVVGVPSAFSANNETIKIIVHGGSFTNATAISTTGNTITGIVDIVSNTFATGIVVGSTNTAFVANSVGAVGLAATTGTFTSNTPYAFVYGRLSNTYANVASLSTGSGATFDVGLLTNTEQVFINVDRLAANNVFNQPFMNVKLTSIGFIENVTVVNKTPNTTHLFASGGGTLYLEGDQQPLVFTGGNATSNATGVVIAANGVVTAITVGSSADRGTGYTNNQPLVFVGNTRTVNAALSTARLTATILAGNTLGLYAGLAVSGNGVPSNTFISAIDAEAGILYLTNAPSSNSSSAVLSFPATGYITTNATGSITSLTLTSQGSGYSSAPVITVAGGTGANLTAAISNGVVVDTRIDTIGAMYDSSVVVTVATSGVSANLQAVIDSGYGFLKDPNADLDTILANALTSNTFTLGTIAGITDINLGAGYNQDPFVLVLEPITYGFNRRDISLGHDNPLNNFVVGEIITQVFSVEKPLVTYSGKNSFDFSVGELVIQGDPANTSSPRGVISQVEETSSTTGVFVVMDATGTFTANATPVLGQTSGASASITSVGTTSALQTNRGRVKSVANGFIGVERLSFDLSFTPNVPIVGAVSGATANVISTSVDEASMPIGFNAEITADAGVVEGFIQTVDIIDSGFAYKELEPVELRRADNPYIGAGYARLRNQGQGEGYFLSERGFLNDNWNYIHDNDYWQEYSYEVRTGISLSKYGDILKQASHVAGTKLFGAIEKVTENKVMLSATGLLSTGDTKFVLANGVGNTFVSGEFITIGSTTVGFANGNVYGEFYIPGFVDVPLGTQARTPNNSTSNASIVIRTQSYTGSANNRMFFTGDTVSGALLSTTANTIELYTNTYIVSVSNTVSHAAGDVVYQLPSALVESFRLSGANSFITNSRASTATYRTANGYLTTASANVIRPNYNSSNTYVGLLSEPARTNLIVNSSDLTSTTGGWTLAGTTVIANDINDLFGSQTVDKILTAVVSGVHEVKRNGISVTNGQKYTLSCFFRKAEYNFAALTLPASRFGADQTVIVNLTTGATSNYEGSASAVVEQYADGWYRLGISAVAQSSGTGTFYIRVASNASTISFTPALSTAGIHAFGAQLEAGSMSTYIPTGGSVATRAADAITLTTQGWAAIGNAAGVVRAVYSNSLAVSTMTRINFVNGANNGPIIQGFKLIQGTDSNARAMGDVMFSNSSTLVVTTTIGPFSKSYGPAKLANVQIFAVASNSTSNANVLQVGENVSQNTGSTTIQGTVYSKNTSHVIVSSTTGTFVASTNNTIGRLIGSVSGANVFITNANTINIPIANTVRLTGFETGHIVGQNVSSQIISTVTHNSVAFVDTVTASVSNAINKLSISEYTGAPLGSTVRGMTSNTTAIITSIER